MDLAGTIVIQDGAVIVLDGTLVIQEGTLVIQDGAVIVLAVNYYQMALFAFSVCSCYH